MAMQPSTPRKKQHVEKVITVPGNLKRGCDDFNEGRFFESHEHFEEIWQYERGPVRDLYKGLIQIAAGFVHLSRGNRHGSERLLRTALGYLAPYRERGALGFDVEAIATAAEDVYRRIAVAGQDNVRSIDLSRRPVFAFDEGRLAAEARRWRAWGFDEQGIAEPQTIVIAE